MPKFHALGVCIATLTVLSLALLSPGQMLSPFNSLVNAPKVDDSSYEDATALFEAMDFSIPLTDTLLSAHDPEQQVTVDESSPDLDNFDDAIADVDLKDADQEINREVLDLAKQDASEQKRNLITGKWFSENIEKGDSFSSLFSDLNIPMNLMMSILSHSDVSKQLHNLQIGQQVSFWLDDDGQLRAFVKPINDKEQLRFYRTNTESPKFEYVKEKLGAHLGDENGLPNVQIAAEEPAANDSGAAESPAESKTQEVITAKETVTEEKTPPAPVKPAHLTRGRLVIVTINKGETFSGAANKAGVTYAEINNILQMFKGRIQFSRNIRPGDTMRVLYTDTAGKGKICAVEFNLGRGGKVASYLNPADGKYYDEKGMNSTKSSFRRFPLNGKVTISSQFNPNRRHPVTGVVRPHNGTDFAVKIGTPVVAPADGVVDKATYTRSTGYYIVLRHRGGYSTVYMHLSKLGVKQGQHVKMGETIARSGNTGLSTGPHLHYELRMNGRPVNAMRVNLGAVDAEVNAKERKRFASSVAQYKKDLHRESLIAKN